LISYILSLVTNRSIFRLGVWAFTGFAALLPVVVAGLYWPRSTKSGAIACILTVVVLWIYFFLHAGTSDTYTVAGTGIMPVAVILAASTVAMIFVSLVTKPPEAATISKFFPVRAHRQTVLSAS
jgi:SSS family solute:Na+ symporter